MERNRKSAKAAGSRFEREEWRPVVGYEGLYEVSSYGRVRGLDRALHRKDGRPQTWKGRLLKPVMTKKGYLRVGLRRGGEKKVKFVHRLVLEAFVGSCPDGMETLHRDGNPENNRVENLRWGSHGENMLDRVRHGRHYNANKTHCPRGHELIQENVPEFRKKTGWRTCLACDRAKSHVGRHPELSGQLQEVSDRYYEAIMEGK